MDGAVVGYGVLLFVWLNVGVTKVVPTRYGAEAIRWADQQAQGKKQLPVVKSPGEGMWSDACVVALRICGD